MFSKCREIKYFTIILSLMVFCSCKNSRLKKVNEDGKGFQAKIEVSAGDYIDYINGDTLEFLTFPFNVGTFENSRKEKKSIIIVGKSIRHGQKVSFKPVSKLTYKNKKGDEKNLIVARPLELKYITAPVNDFFELISKYYGIQKTIETWITFSKGYGETSNVSWENEIVAINYLSN